MNRPNDWSLQELEEDLKYFIELQDNFPDEIDYSITIACIRQAIAEYNQHN